jgi:hypothetical protein
MIRLTGTSSFFPVRVCGTAVTAMMSSGTCRGEACAAMALLTYCFSSSSSEAPGARTTNSASQ